MGCFYTLVGPCFWGCPLFLRFSLFSVFRLSSFLRSSPLLSLFLFLNCFCYCFCNHPSCSGESNNYKFGCLDKEIIEILIDVVQWITRSGRQANNTMYWIRMLFWLIAFHLWNAINFSLRINETQKHHGLIHQTMALIKKAFSSKDRGLLHLKTFQSQHNSECVLQYSMSLTDLITKPSAESL